MNIITSSSMNFRGNTTQEKNNNAYLSAGIIAGATILGTGIGYKLYDSDKVEIQNSIKNEKEKSDKTSPDFSKESIFDELEQAKEEAAEFAEKSKKQISEKLDPYLDELQEFQKGDSFNEPSTTVLVETEEAFEKQIAFLHDEKQKPVNVIMIKSKDHKISDEFVDLVQWGMSQDGHDEKYNFVKILEHTNSTTLQESLASALDSAEENYQKTQKRTLIHVEGFDKLINPQHNSEANIECLKDIMGACAKDNHSTIIFSATDTSKLDQITLQPHRVEQSLELSDKIHQSDLEKFRPFRKKLSLIKEELKPILEEQSIRMKKLQQNMNLLLKKADEISLAKAKQAEYEKQIKQLETKLSKLPKTKIFIGTTIGALVGSLGVILKNSQQNKT